MAESMKREKVAIHFNRGERYLEEGDLMMAVEEFKAVLKVDPEYKKAKDGLDKVVSTFYIRGLDFYEAGKYKEAISEWEIVLGIEPAHTGARSRMYSAKRKLKTLEERRRRMSEKEKAEERRRKKESEKYRIWE